MTTVSLPPSPPQGTSDIMGIPTTPRQDDPKADSKEGAEEDDSLLVFIVLDITAYCVV